MKQKIPSTYVTGKKCYHKTDKERKSEKECVCVFVCVKHSEKGGEREREREREKGTYLILSSLE